MEPPGKKGGGGGTGTTDCGTTGAHVMGGGGADDNPEVASDPYTSGDASPIAVCCFSSMLVSSASGCGEQPSLMISRRLSNPGGNSILSIDVPLDTGHDCVSRDCKNPSSDRGL